MDKKQTANELKKSITQYLNLNGHFAWVQNNLRVPGRAFIGMKGVPDICCIMKGGKFLGIEVKAGNDKPSEHQFKFQHETERRGGYYFFVGSLDEVIRIVSPAAQLK
jgi:hypothetical protein